MTDFRLDELAREGGVASTTVRLYQSKGLLHAPRLQGRTGWYDQSHLDRLRLIARLQDQGFSLAGIARLLDQWHRGGTLDAVIGVEAELDALLGEAHAVVLDGPELLDHFPAQAMTTDLMQRAVSLGLVELIDDGRIRVADRRFLDTGAELARLGVPLDVVLDEWEVLVAHTDDIAARFIAVFEQHLAPPDRRTDLSSDDARHLANALAQLQVAARQVLAASLDASIARLGRARLGDLLTPPS